MRSNPHVGIAIAIVSKHSLFAHQSEFTFWFSRPWTPRLHQWHSNSFACISSLSWRNVVAASKFLVEFGCQCPFFFSNCVNTKGSGLTTRRHKTILPSSVSLPQLFRCYSLCVSGFECPTRDLPRISTDLQILALQPCTKIVICAKSILPVANKINDYVHCQR